MFYCVNFTDNKIRDEGAKIIGEALKTNTTLTEINLVDSNNHFYDMNYYYLLTFHRQ